MVILLAALVAVWGATLAVSRVHWSGAQDSLQASMARYDPEATDPDAIRITQTWDKVQRKVRWCRWDAAVISAS